MSTHSASRREGGNERRERAIGQRLSDGQEAQKRSLVAKQVVLQNPMGPFIPSSNLRQKLPSQPQA